MLNTEGTMLPPRKEHLSQFYPLALDEQLVHSAVKLPSVDGKCFLLTTFIVLSRLIDQRGNAYGNEL